MSDAHHKHPEICNNTTGFYYTDDALWGEKVGVSIQVLFFRHEDFTMSPFTTWWTGMKTLRRKKERKKGTYEQSQVQIRSHEKHLTAPFRDGMAWQGQ
jgi:hypothetical protein